LSMRLKDIPRLHCKANHYFQVCCMRHKSYVNCEKNGRCDAEEEL